MADNKEIVAAFATRMEQRDWAAFAALLDPDVVYEIPQTRERIRGRDNYVRFNAEFPGDWHIEPRVIVADDEHGSLLFEWTLAGESALAIAFFEFGGGGITKITDFWPDPYELPASRAHLVERY